MSARHFIATFEAELAVNKLEQETIAAEGESPKQYEEFIQQTEAEAIEKKDELVEEQKEEDEFSDPDAEMGDGQGGEGGDQGDPDDLDDSSDLGDSGDSDGDSGGEDDPQEVDDADAIDDAEAQADLAEEKAATSENLNAITTGLGQAASFVTASLSDLMMGLGRLGIKYTPILGTMMYKGVIWMFSRTGTLLYRTGVSIGKYIESNYNSATRLSDRLDSCMDRLNALVENSVQRPKEPYRNKAVINRIKVGKRLTVAYNLDQTRTGLETVIKSLVEEAKNGYNIIEKLAETNPHNGPKHLDALLEVNASTLKGMSPGYADGFKDDTGLVLQYKSVDVYPGDMVFMLNAPQCRNREMESIAQAYREASSFLAVDTASIKLIEQMDYMSPHDLVRVVQSARRLVEMMRSLDSTYKELQKVQPSLAYSVKKLFLQLADDEAKTRLSSSYIEPMYLRSSLASSALIHGVMDLNTYVSRLVAASVQLVEDHIRKMS